MSGVHHFVPVLHRGDAVGRHTLRLREASRQRGFRSDIFVDTVDDETADETLPVLSYPDQAEPGDVIVYQFATASAMAPWLAGRSETLVVNYHNVTPPELMAPWDNHLALGQLRAQGDLRLLAPRATLAVADSVYNEGHLTAAGFVRTAVVSPSAALPALIESDATVASSAAITRPGRGARWLAVGRVSPNKALEHTIAALAVARAHDDPEATLQLVGKPATDSYVTALHRYVAELGVGGAVQFAGHASDATVASAYAGADVLVVTSEHEGFCVPVVEAMAAGVPVVAFDQGAVPEVLGGAGVLVADGIPTRWQRPSPQCCGTLPPPRRSCRRRPAAHARARSGDGRGALRRPPGPSGDAGCHLAVSGIHQFVPMLHRADAVGRHTLRFRDVLVARGIPSHVYVEMDDPATASETRPLAATPPRPKPGTCWCTSAPPLRAWAPGSGARGETLVVNYHNVTPPEYYAPWDNGMARHQLLAQTQLRELAPRAALGLAVSTFNEAELRAAGFRHTAVVPPADMLPAGAAPALAVRPPKREGARWLSVGRLAPNKAIELAVMALLVTRAHHDPQATLHVVGRSAVSSYTAALQRFVDELGLHAAVTFSGAVSDDALVARMRAADVLMATSRHEGFGVPVLEAMSSGLPVVANEAGALPEVVGDAGLLVDAENPYALADAAVRAAGDGGSGLLSPRRRNGASLC